jgi:D-hydroxyproline dehydrogenase subunit gamma
VTRVGSVVTVTIDGRPTAVSDGETVAVTLLNAGRRAWRTTPAGEPRGVFCAIGICFDCTVTVDGVASVRACMTRVRDGMRVTTERAP